MSHYKIKGNSLVQDCQINDRSNLQSKLSENINIIYTYIVDQIPLNNCLVHDWPYYYNRCNLQ